MLFISLKIILADYGTGPRYVPVPIFYCFSTTEIRFRYPKESGSRRLSNTDPGHLHESFQDWPVVCGNGEELVDDGDLAGMELPDPGIHQQHIVLLDKRIFLYHSYRVPVFKTWYSACIRRNEYRYGTYLNKSVLLNQSRWRLILFGGAVEPEP